MALVSKCTGYARSEILRMEFAEFQAHVRLFSRLGPQK